jgi:hypothetical protein
MKTFNKTSLPESITYNGEVYSRTILQPIITGTLQEKISLAKATGKKVVVVNVLSRNLKGKTDLYGKPYKPTEWIFLH